MAAAPANRWMTDARLHRPQVVDEGPASPANRRHAVQNGRSRTSTVTDRRTVFAHRPASGRDTGHGIIAAMRPTWPNNSAEMEPATATGARWCHPNREACSRPIGVAQISQVIVVRHA